MAKAKQTAKQANAKTRQATAAEKAIESDTVETSAKTPTKKEAKDLSALEKTPETPEEFKSMCGFPFDPAPAGSCTKTCKGENPEAFKACQENFKATAKKSTPGTTSKSKRGKNTWGHLNGCQGALIDDRFLTAGGAHTLEEIMTAAGASRPRVISHLKHLVAVWNVDLRITSEKAYFVQGMKSDGLEGSKTDGVKIIEMKKAA
ncbi:MAG: hypothetical protein KAH23_05900 [Kiritimatiellae bacterium]|nr:hypothetical protein [Kiritimatiellia bacterium]